MDQIALTHFLTFRFDEESFRRPFDELAPTLPHIFASPAAVFGENLRSVISTVSLPAKLATAFLRRFRGAIENLTETGLASEISDASLWEPASELLLQGTVLTWTALEVLANDLFVQLLNFVPDLAETLMKDERTKKWFQLKAVALETLGKFGYDVSKKMGLLMTEKQTISTTQVIRDVFDVLASESEQLRNLLLDNRLWILNHRRNLIVHRKAVVDESYISNTGDNLALGSRLEVTITGVQADLELVRDIGLEMLRALPARLKMVPSGIG